MANTQSYNVFNLPELRRHNMIQEFHLGALRYIFFIDCHRGSFMAGSWTAEIHERSG